jgi:nitroreductase/ferredoxin
MNKITINEIKCQKCGTCTKVCPISLIKIIDNNFPTMTDSKKLLCINCGHCEAYCPESALSLSYAPIVSEPPVFTDNDISVKSLENYFRSRRSVRLFTNDIIDKSVVQQAISIAAYSPSGKNDQPVHWTIVLQKDKLQKLIDIIIQWSEILEKENSPLTRIFPAATVIKHHKAGHDIILRGAPALAITHTANDSVMGTAAVTDGIIAMSHFDLILPSLGLGGFWAGFFYIALKACDAVRKELNIPNNNSIAYPYAFGIVKHKITSFPKRKNPNIDFM